MGVSGTGESNVIIQIQGRDPCFEPFGFGLLGLPFDSHHECILLKRLLHEKRVYRRAKPSP